MKMIKIGLMGLNYQAKNFGCAALSYSFLKILDVALVHAGCRAIVTFVFSITTKWSEMPAVNYDTMDYQVIKYDKKRVMDLLCEIKKCDIFFDFTAGDSFSDIYGLERFMKRTFVKSCVEFAHKPLVLGPQTYGPYKNKIAQIWAGHVFKHAHQIYARDSQSRERVRKLVKRDVMLVTDVAFALDYDKKLFPIVSDCGKLKFGINMSGLLYSGGYTRDNQFGLKTDYSNYLELLMEYLMAAEKYEVHIIPHAIADSLDFPDNDLIPTKVFSEKYPQVIVAPVFKNPMEAKSYICQMDVFTGARMHATIGAFASGVCCIPFSYSPKFEGLYSDLKYSRCISGKDLTTEEAVKLTIEYIENMEQLKAEQEKSLILATKRLGKFEQDIGAILRHWR